jgi:hypothetical protein
VDTSLWDDWRAELRAKPWLRLALGGAAVLVAVMLLLDLEAWVHGARQEQLRLTREIDRMESMAGEAHWRRQRDEVFALLATLRERAWREESEGRMQALMQDWTRAQLENHGLPPRELVATVLPATDAAGAGPGANAGADEDLRRVRVRVAFDFDADQLTALLEDFAVHPQPVQVARMSVANGARRAVELELEAVFVLATRGTP